MNKDIRISVDFFDHPKTMKLKRRLGSDGVECLLKLWMFAAKERSSGTFVGMDEEDIELAAKWTGEPLKFVTTLVELRWLIVNDRCANDKNSLFSLHDWAENNGWAAKSGERSDKARFSLMAKSYPAIYAELKEKGVKSISQELYASLTTVNDSLEKTTKMLTPSPSPSPSPSLKTLKPAVSETELKLRECIAGKKDFLSKNYPFSNIELETEEIVDKFKNQSIGVDPGLIVLRWFKNLKPPAQPTQVACVTPEYSSAYQRSLARITEGVSANA